jgi:lipoprotein-anchoring transpeptidase ErfK/SrfK
MSQQRQRRRSSGAANNQLLWLGVAATVVALCWLWWRASHPHKPAPSHKEAPAHHEPPARTNAPIPPPSAKPPAIPPLPAFLTNSATPAVHTNSHPATNPPLLPPQSPTPQTATYATPVLKQPPGPVSTTNPLAKTYSPNTYPRPARNPFEAQVVLSQLGISAGSIDGKLGSQTHAALRAFQQKSGLPITGQLDAATREALVLNNSPITEYILTSNDLARLQPLSATWLGKSQQTALDYETALELVAEKGHAHPALIRQLNPSINWSNVPAGAAIQIPNAEYPEPETKAAFLIIRLSEKTLEAFDAETNLLIHFPCSIAQRVEKRPVGELHVAVVAPNPNYTFDPSIFPESAEAREIKTKLILKPGPNNPVGLAWIGLDMPGYGIHGTPSPEQVGRTESHGCFRLANWNAEYLVHLVPLHTPVYVNP